jgi:hypothetical protein
MQHHHSVPSIHTFLPPSFFLRTTQPPSPEKKSLHYLTRISQKQPLGQPHKREEEEEEEEEEEKAFQPSLLPPPPPFHLLACPCVEPKKNPTIAVGSSKKTKHNAMPHTHHHNQNQTNPDHLSIIQLSRSSTHPSINSIKKRSKSKSEQ